VIADELIPDIEEEGFRCHVRAKRVRQFIAVILEHWEGETTLGGVAIYCLRRFRLLMIRRRGPPTVFFAKFAAEKIAQITRAAGQ
jgi:hypothetical protein